MLTREIDLVPVADDHPVTREGPRLEIQRQDRGVRLGLRRSRRTGGDARTSSGRALLDYKMPELLDGLQVIYAMTRESLPTNEKLLSAFDDSPVVYKALAKGDRLSDQGIRQRRARHGGAITISVVRNVVSVSIEGRSSRPLVHIPYGGRTFAAPAAITHYISAQAFDPHWDDEFRKSVPPPESRAVGGCILLR